MSNYNSLKTTIDANIKQNGNQEITGQILNSVLNQMVNTLGAGYQFAGVATINTNPGTPDAKVFYIANGKGTYEKFGGLEVTEDEVVVLYWDSSWHKVATGIASQEKLSELVGAEYDTSSKGKSLNVALTKTGGVEGADYVNTDVSYHPLSDKIKLSYKLKTLNESHPVICFYNSNKELISYIDGGNTVQGEIYPPVGTAFFRYCTTEEIYCYLNTYGELDSIKKDIFNINVEENIKEYTATQGYYVPANAINEDLQSYDAASISSTIFLEKGSTISTFDHKVNGAISAIAKKNTDNTYTSLVENNNSSSYMYTATEDCYVIISFLQELGTPIIKKTENVVSHLIEKTNTLYSLIDKINAESILQSKKVGFIGDSICYGHSYLGGYGKIIAERNNMQYQNLAQNGATITDNTDGRFHICQHINDIDADCDYVILEGGVNDSVLLGNGEISSLGTISYGSDAELDLNTFAGALEHTLKQAIIRFNGKKIGYVIPHLITHGMEWYQPPVIKPIEKDNVYYTIINACRKWGVPVCDLTGVVPCFEDMASSQSMAFMAQLYCPDGWHPNEAGYKKYYCDKIESWMKTL